MSSTRVYVAWCVIVLVALGGTLGWQVLRDPDEGRNAEVAREMVVTGEWVLPHLNGLPYLDKPVVYFAMGAASISAFGPNEFAARLPGFLASLATALIIGLYARRLWGADAGRIAGLAAIAAPLPLAFSRIVIMDSTLTFLVVASILAFHRAVEARRSGDLPGWIVGWGRYSLLAWALIGVGILTKGPVALLYPLLVVLPYAIWRRQPWAFLHPLGPVVMVAIVAPWLAVVTRKVPDFVRYVIDTEIVARVSSDVLLRSKPWWYYGPMMLIGAAPWSFALLRWRRRRHGSTTQGDPAIVLLALWVLVPMVLFSLMKTKMPQYLLPSVPAIALLLGAHWGRDHEGARGSRIGAIAWLVLGAILVPWGAGWLPLAEVDADVADAAAKSGLLLGGLFLVSGCAALLVTRRGAIAVAVALSIPVVFLPMAATPILDASAVERSGHDLADEIRARTDGDVEVIGVGWWSPSLAFYLERPFPFAATDALELGSNYIDHNFDRYAGPGANLRTYAAVERLLADCDTPRIVVVGQEGREFHDPMVAAGYPVFFERRRTTAYGPGCVPPEPSPE